MSSYENRVRASLRKDKPVAELIMKAKVLVVALKESFPDWKNEEKMRKFIRELERDPEGLVKLQDEEGVLLK